MTEPLVLLPDFMCDGRLFAGLIARHSADRALILGHFGAKETVEDAARQALAAAPARFALAGAGLGGMVAMEMLRQAPTRVARLALIQTSALSESPAAAAARETRIIAAQSGRLAEAMAADIDTLRPAAAAEALRMAAALGPEAFRRQSRMLQRRRDQQATLRRLRQPAMVICGAEDPQSPPARHEVLAALVPWSELVVVPGAGRLPTLEAPEAVNLALDQWLAQPFVLR